MMLSDNDVRYRLEKRVIPEALQMLRLDHVLGVGLHRPPARLSPISALCILAPRGHQEAVDLMAAVFDLGDDETFFAGRRDVALLFAALDIHPGYIKTKYWWDRVDDTAPDITIINPPDCYLPAAQAWPRQLIAWFCETHPVQAAAIERDLKNETTRP
jgi:hypothetical protein